MRRPRSKLEVSTFPFLAVLLCTMGALLLLLFIMDRRAKIASRYRITEELQARQARTKAEEDARQSAWEKAKAQLHQSLLDQQNQLLANSKGLQENISDASQKLASVQGRHGELDQKIRNEATAIGLLQIDIDNQRAGLQQVDKKETMTKAELTEAAKELAELERAFQLLRALKDREKQTYSVVPYRGKRGDTRPPIYVECVRDGVIFHPEKNLLQAWDFTPSSILGEVERRHGPLAVQKTVKKVGDTPSEEPKGPYVLFLIRPDGIGSYYKAQGALKGYQLDFGYELVDADWALEFTGGALAKNLLPGRAPVPWKDGPEGRPIVTPPPGFGGNGGGKEGSLRGSTSPFPPSSGSAPGFGMGGGNPGLPPPPNGSGGNGNPFFAQPPSPGNSTSAGVNTGIPFKPPTFVPISKNPPLVPIASSGGQPGLIASSGTPNGAGQTGNSFAGNSSSGKASSGSPNGSGQPGNPSSGTPNGLGQPTNPGSGNAIASSGSPNGSGQSGNPPTGTASNGTSNSGNNGTRQPGSNTSGGAGSPGNGNADGSSEGSAIKSFPPFGVDPGKKPPPAPPLSRLLGNKDFIITIDCHNDYVTVNPGSLTYRWTATNLQATDQALTQAIANLIARRQASVRTGEPPYRPLIRFQVPSEGLRTYYHVYPILEHLKVPMTRENVAE